MNKVVAVDRSASALATAELLDSVGRRLHLRAFRDGLNPAQWAALRFFARPFTDSPTAVAFARYQGISRTSANQTVRALVDKGLLNRQVSEQDARCQNVELTAAGHGLLRRDPLLDLQAPIAGLPLDLQQSLAAALSMVLPHLAEEEELAAG